MALRPRGGSSTHVHKQHGSSSSGSSNVSPQEPTWYRNGGGDDNALRFRAVGGKDGGDDVGVLPTTWASATTTSGAGGRSGRRRRRHQRTPFAGSASASRRATCLGLAVAAFCLLVMFCCFFAGGPSLLVTSISGKGGRGRRAAASSPATTRRRRTMTNISPRPPDADGVYDVAVLGAGPAGLTAALFAARAGLSVLVLGSSAGLLSETTRLDNFPSWTDDGGGGASFSRSKSSSLLLEEEGSLAGGANGGGPGWLFATRGQAESFGATFAPPGLLASGVSVSIQQRPAPGGRRSSPFELDVPGLVMPDLHSRASPVEGQQVARAHSIIVATGATPRRLDLPGEDALWGRYVHSCAICDGAMYADRVVVVVGGGDAAVDAALLLSRYAARVVVVHRRDEFRSTNREGIEAMRSASNVEIVTPYVVERWVTETATGTAVSPDAPVTAGTVSTGSTTRLSSVVLSPTEGDTTGARRRIDCDGAFVLIGATPNTDFLRNTSGGVRGALAGIVDKETGLVRLGGGGEGEAGSGGGRQSTLMPGVFAAGEVVDDVYRQAVTAAAEGARAAIDAERWLRLTRGIGVGKGATKKGAISSGEGQHGEQRTTASDVTAPAGDGAPAGGGSENDASGETDCDLTEVECIRSLVARHPVVVFSKPWCPYCQRALEALSLEGVTRPRVIDLADMGAEGRRVQETLRGMTGRRTVPNVFVGGRSIGGGDETTALRRNGGLTPLLRAAGAIS